MAANPEFQYLLNEYYEGILLFEIMEKEVWNKAADDSVGQYNYYQQNKGKYTAPDRVKGTIYSGENADAVNNLKSLVAAGNAKAIQEYVLKNKIKAETGFFKKEDKPILASVPWEPGVYAAENKGMYYLAWIKEVLPAGEMSFEEARPVLISDYQNHLEQIWLKDLRRKFPVKMSEKGRKVVFQQLQKS